ncbi:LysR family transcriptional regulator [Enterovirga sp. CN4-39]|uniref:LysR family transcriptional regulator n=1 Tax=Enterovirga sp. CN4-39 TaxID=3400910 RepID=UPI003C0A4509
MDRGDRYFLMVATTGSLRKAADQLRIASSAISRQIAMLEDELGIELFERARQGMALTQAGEIYLAYVRNASQEADRVHSELDALKGLQRGHVKVVTVEGLVSDFVMRACLDFRRRYPGVTLELSTAGSHMVTRSILEREADIGISMNAKDEDGIDVIFSQEDPLLLVMAPDHELRRADAVRITEVVAQFPFALPPPSFGIRSLVDACVPDRLSPALVTNSIEALRAFARLGHGVTFLPSLAVREDLASGRLVGVRLADPRLRGMVTDVYIAQGRRPPLPAEKLLSCLKAAL